MTKRTCVTCTLLGVVLFAGERLSAKDPPQLTEEVTRSMLIQRAEPDLPKAYEQCKAALTSSPIPGVLKVENGIEAPKPLVTPGPQYSDEARKKGVGGSACTTVVVGADGSVTDVLIRQGLGYGLDEKILDTVRQWKFSPAVKNGAPVPVQIAVEFTFRLY